MATHGSFFIPASSLKPGCFRHSIWALYCNSPPPASQISAVLSPLLHDAPFSVHIIERLTLHALGLSINSFMSYFFAPLVIILHWDFLDPPENLWSAEQGFGDYLWVCYYLKGESLINTRELGGFTALGLKARGWEMDVDSSSSFLPYNSEQFLLFSQLICNSQN